MLAVRWYLRYWLSYRDVEELLAERGIEVDHVTSTAGYNASLPYSSAQPGPYRHVVGSRWFVDETYVKVAGTWNYVYRAVDQNHWPLDGPFRRVISQHQTWFGAVATSRGRPARSR